MITMTKEIMSNLIKQASAIKTDIIFIRCDGLVLGTDPYFSYLKTMQLPTTFDFQMCYISNDMNKFMKAMNEDVAISHFNFEKDNTILKSNDGPYMYINNPFNIFNIEQMCLRLNNYFNNPISYQNLDIRLEEDFENLSQLKSTEGMGMYKIQTENGKYILSVFKSLLSLTKKDKVELTIKDIDNVRFLSHFKITKSKTVEINVYIQNMIK